ncbi:hypothetical protein [Herbaspirillum rubrisubalbicans]|uniref:endonuclease toxin domain-containing protein n=1 Tax=Herbaspirillum rubrisubalbicans TaxID=80842 RepID=UPI001D2D6F04|nr:hypothetical protein [Herbaspirillum rubrisubalbicans]
MKDCAISDQSISKCRGHCGPEDILSKQMQLAIPASTNTEQLAAIAKSIQYAQSKQIQIVVTKIK